MRGQRPGPLVGSPERFWSHVDRSAGPESCWPWTAATSAGRGRVYVNGRTVYAYRHAWFLTHGEQIPRHRSACHKCDNPTCVNPAHSFIGTQRDNIRDAATKGRTARMSGAPDDEVRAVREMYATGCSAAAVAAHFGRPLGPIEDWIAGKSRLAAGGPVGCRSRAAA